jgi:FG-GAP-like repeat
MKILNLLFIVFLAGNAFAAHVVKNIYRVGQEPQVVVAADFNNDGILDLATADFTSADVSILLGKGDGTFQKARHFSTTYGASSLAVCDFNHDGNLDIAVTEYGFNTPGILAIFLGEGNGSFKPGAVYQVGTQPYSVTTADFNQDGKIDLAAANNGDNEVAVLFGNGDGTFQSPVNYQAPLPERVLGVDLNGDGYPDLAILAYCGNDPQNCPNGAVQVMLNNGNGTFGNPNYYQVGVGPDGIAVAELRHNGKIDLAVANNNFQAPSTVSVLLGNGDGTFQPAVNYAVGDGPAGITLADFTGNGNDDIAVANVGDGELSFLLGNGNGTFQPAVTLSGPSGTAPLSVAAGDFNGDGVLDLAVALDYANSVVVLLNPR